MSEDAMANDVQEFQDNQWAVPLPHTLPPTKWAQDLAAHLRAAGYIHRSEAAFLPIHDQLEKEDLK